MPEEQNQVINHLVKSIQAVYFAEELKSLTNLGIMNRNSFILKLNPFIDNHRVLRVGGRLKASFISYAAKHPILLPRHHPFSHVIINHEHEIHFHAGPQATLAAVR